MVCFEQLLFKSSRFNLYKQVSKWHKQEMIDFIKNKEKIRVLINCRHVTRLFSCIVIWKYYSLVYETFGVYYYLLLYTQWHFQMYFFFKKKFNLLLYLFLTDFQKAFDKVNRKTLEKILVSSEFGEPYYYLGLVLIWKITLNA